MDRKNIFEFSILITLFLFLACAGPKGEAASASSDGSRPSPLTIWITKGNLDIPVQIQVSNRTQRVLSYLEVEFSFEDTLGGMMCKIAVDVIDDDWVLRGKLDRISLRQNGTNLYRIGVSELDYSDCWRQVVESWPNVTVSGRITGKEFTEPDNW